MLAWELPASGWEVEILSPDESYQNPSFIEPESGPLFPPDGVVHHVKGWREALFRKLGMRSIGWRSLVPMYHAGLKLLRSKRYDLVYFSTTQFPLFCLGPLWERQTSVPYVLDFHDPWSRPAGKYRTTKSRIKSTISEILARFLERFSVVNADGIVSVSPNYVTELEERYRSAEPRWLRTGAHAVSPFGARVEDFTGVRHTPVPEPGEPGRLRFVYVGAGGEIMAHSFSLICRALAHLREGGHVLAARTRIELYGTGYTADRPGRKYLEEVAAGAGVGDLVSEHPGRVSYQRSLELLKAADGALVLGVDDPAYMPSKLFSYALSGKPLLASFHAESPACRTLKENPQLGYLLIFGGAQEMRPEDASAEVARCLEEMAGGNARDLRSVLRPHLASAMAERHAKLFERVLSSRGERSRPVAGPRRIGLAGETKDRAGSAVR